MESDFGCNFLFPHVGDISESGFDQRASSLCPDRSEQIVDQNDLSGFPLLLRQYFNQQQQHQELSQQHISAPSILDSNFALCGRQGVGVGLANSGNDTNNSIMGMQDMMTNWSRDGLSHAYNPRLSQNDLTISDQNILNGLQNSTFASVTNPNMSSFVNSSPPGIASAPSLVRAPSLVNPKAAPVRDIYAEQGIVGPWSERAAGLLGNMFCRNPINPEGKAKRVRRKLPKDKPKRPLSAYNIFFKEERARLLSSNDTISQKRTVNGKIGFENLAKIIGGRWQDLNSTDVQYYKEKAARDMERYKKEMEEYIKKQSFEQQDESSVVNGENQNEDMDSPAGKKQRTSY